jgi:DNA-binding response OmpR family regulator
MDETLNCMRALIVDDEEDIGFMTKVILNNEGIVAEATQSIRQAVYKIHENAYDLYFLDLNLPDGSGFDLVPQIRDSNQQAVVIIISAHDGNEEIKKADELGVDAFIKKPFTKKDIHQAIDEFKRK